MSASVEDSRGLSDARSSIIRLLGELGKRLTVGSGVETNSRKLGKSVGQLETFRSEYTDLHLKEWAVFVEGFDVRARSAIASAEARLEAVRADDASKQSAIRNDLSRQLSDILSARTQREREIRDKYESLKAPTAVTTAPITFFEAIKLDPFQKYWWMFGVSGLILGWVLVNFDFALIAGPAAIISQLWWLRKMQHDEIKGKQEAFEQAQKLINTNRAIATKLRDELAAEVKHQQDLAHEQAARLLAEQAMDASAKLEAHNAATANERMPFHKEWAERCSAFNKRTLELRQRYDQLVFEIGSWLEPFDQGDALHDNIEDLDDQLSFRLGDCDFALPAKLEKELALTLALNERPVSIERRFPVFFELGDRKALFVDGGSQPASAAKHKIF